MANTYFYPDYYNISKTEEDTWYSDDNISGEKEYYYKNYMKKQKFIGKVEDDDCDGIDDFLKICSIFLKNTFSNKFSKDIDYYDSDINNDNSTEAINILQHLCNDYKSNILTGDICSELCNIFSLSNSIKYEFGKNKHIIFLTLNTTTRIFKTSKKYFYQYKSLENNIKNEDFIRLILEIINNHTMLGFPLSYSNHIINMIYPPYKNRSDKILTDSERQTIWRLIQQPEYINYKILKLSRVFPTIVSSCGHLYEVENVVPFKMKTYYMTLKNKILIHLMGTAKLFYEFLNEPLEWCDVKFNNLGLSQNYGKRFLILDADKLYTKSKLENIFGNLSCSSDNDCSLGDCLSKCNNITNTCYNQRINENLDIFCNKLITPLYGRYFNKNNKFLMACFGTGGDKLKRLNELRLAWAWNLPDV
ncbi:Protein FAM69C [Strongyloides ratti]|uniref:Protein FAM69C n=1 Tax=Strongyloides ratti TaxID=34506 RepID=A0A090L7S0_STRRB|nr:Protein FAM69C [Strongyloides ratti]CEF65846.1 Protein FAM69C [Strongyloides ratti]